jgi:SAM-dependent methyltransferase
MEKHGYMTELYNFKYFTRADGIRSWRSQSLKFGDALAGLAYAHNISWQQLKDSFPEVFAVEANGKGESAEDRLVDHQIQFLKDHAARTPKRVLEIGGGRGEVATVLNHMGIDVVSVEPGAGAERWYDETANHYLFKGVKPLVGFIDQVIDQLDLSTFDTILMVESLEHIPEPAFDQVWDKIVADFRGRFITVNWVDYHPCPIGGFGASPEEHCRLVDDALYDKWSTQAECWFRNGSHLVLDFK